jgi:hypothetical protein
LDIIEKQQKQYRRGEGIQDRREKTASRTCGAGGGKKNKKKAVQEGRRDTGPTEKNSKSNLRSGTGEKQEKNKIQSMTTKHF